MKLITLLCLVTFLSSCGNANKDSNSNELFSGGIYGGVEVKNGKWSNVIGFASLNRDGSIKSTFCTGTLISPTQILSAAHCFKRSPIYYSKRVIVTRDSISTENPRTRKIKSISKHPYYKSSDKRHDFALVELEEGFNISEKEIVKPSPRKVFEIDQAVEIVGFGKRENGESGIKFEAQTRVREDQELEFIAGGEGKDTCSGDSGGPVFTTNSKGGVEFVGVTSRTPDDANVFCGDKTFYGKVSVGMNWVKAYKLNQRAKDLNNLESIELLKKSKREFQNYFETNFLLGQIAKSNKLYDLAIESFKKASTLKEFDKESLNELLDIFVELKDTENEAITLGKILIVDPGRPKLFNRLSEISGASVAQTKRAMGYFKRNSLDFTLEDLEGVESEEASFLRAFSYLKMGRLDEALENIKKVSKLSTSQIELLDRSQDTFFIVSIYEGNLNLVKEAVRLGADIFREDRDGNGATHLAWWGRKLDIIDYLIEIGLTFNLEAHFEQFLSIVKNQKLDEVEYLLKKGMDPHKKGRNGQSAAEIAESSNNPKLVSLIAKYSTK